MTTTPKPTTDLLTADEVAEIMNVGRSTVFRLRDQQYLRETRFGKRIVRFKRSDVEACIAGQRVSDLEKVVPLGRGRRRG